MGRWLGVAARLLLLVLVHLVPRLLLLESWLRSIALVRRLAVPGVRGLLLLVGRRVLLLLASVRLLVVGRLRWLRALQQLIELLLHPSLGRLVLLLVRSLLLGRILHLSRVHVRSVVAAVLGHE